MLHDTIRQLGGGLMTTNLAFGDEIEVEYRAISVY
jgi:hypothetical protein